MRRAALYVLLAGQAVVILGFWAWNHVQHPLGSLLTGELAGQLLAYGRLAGLLAAFGVLLQLVLAGRIGWVEHVFGLDRLLRFHRIAGFSLVLLLIAHPVLLAFGHAMQADVGVREQYIDFLREWRGVAAAAAGLALMLAAVGLSVAIVRRRLRYEVWHATHLTFYVAIALAFGHQLAVGSDFTDNRWFAGYWVALYAFTFGNLAVYRLVRPLLLFARHRFTVERVASETGEATSVYIGGRAMERFKAEGGQFVLVRFLAPGFRWESHPFSISQPPDGVRIRLTIRHLGDFTRRIPQLQPGTRVIVDGPHGVFTARRCRAPKALLIAGGIGITPLRAMADGLLAAGRDVVLLYANRSREGIVFREELERLAAVAGGRLRVVHILSLDPDWPGETGQLDGRRIARLVPDAAEREAFLCGPPPMMKALRAALVKLGAPRARIHYERFSM